MKDRTARHRLISVEGRIGSVDGRGSPSKGTIALVSDQARFRGAVIFPSDKAFFEYDVSLAKHITPRRARRLLGVSRIYSELSDDFDESWMTAACRESTVVTNRANWTRHTAGLDIVLPSDRTKQRAEVTIENVLLCGVSGGGDGGRTLLASPKTLIPGSEQIPVGVLDGAEALRSLDMVRCPNIIVLLERSEYDDAVKDQLTRLNSVRNDDRLPVPSDIPKDMPGGIDMVMFAFATKQT